jgi:hypothetical protein
MPTPVPPTKYEPARSPRVIHRMPSMWEQENVEVPERDMRVILIACAIGGLAVLAVVLYWLVIR